MKKDFHVIVLGWLEPDIIERCLTSINKLEGVNPYIYFVENNSKNSNKIKPLILSTPNIEGFIRIKENRGACAWKIIMEHFLKRIDEEFVTITDGDYEWDCYAIRRQYEAFNTHADIGVVSQRRKTTCPHLSGTALLVPNGVKLNFVNGMWSMPEGTSSGSFAGSFDERSTNPALKKGMTRSTCNGMNLTTSRKKHWETFIDCVNRRHINCATILPTGLSTEARPPVFWDTDFYNFVESVLKKASFIINDHPSYHITDEYEVAGEKRETDYYKEKKEFNYGSQWENYFADPDSFHNHRYQNKELKYEIII